MSWAGWVWPLDLDNARKKLQHYLGTIISLKDLALMNI